MIIAVSGLLAVAAFGLHGWISGTPVWPGIVASTVGFGCGAVLFVIGLGQDLKWWPMSGSAFDILGRIWIGVTISAVAIAAILSQTAGR